MSPPSDWKKVRFGEIAEQIVERVDNPKDFQNYDYIGLEHIETEQINISKYGKSEDVKSSKFLCKKGDIIFGRRRAYLHKLAVCDRDALVSTDAIIIRPKIQIIKEYLILLMQTDYFWEQAIALSAGSLSPRVKWRELSNIEFYIPPINIQSKISELLWSIQINQEKIEKLIQVSEKLKKGLLEELLIKGIGHTKFKKSELGEIPEEWEIKNMGLVAKVNSGGSAPQGNEYFEGKLPFIRVQHIEQDAPQINKWDLITEDAVTKYKLKLFPKKTIVFPKSGATVFLEKRAFLPQDSYVVSHLCCINSKEELMNQDYLFYFLKRICLAPKKELIQYPTINLSYINKIKIPVPPLKEQNEIVYVLKNMDSFLEHCKKNLINLTDLKKMLTNSFLSGESLISKEVLN